MKRHILLIIILMGLCVSGIIGLQLFWNYQNYKSTVKTFDHDINEALRAATDREIDQRHQVIVKQFAHWMNDTSFVTITCNIKNRDHKTVFNVNDTHPYTPVEKGFSMSVKDFKPQLTQINQAAKAYFIKHFSNDIVRTDLKKGIIFYYTQRLGDSLKSAFFKNKFDNVTLNRFYREELTKRGIETPFVITGPLNRTKTTIRKTAHTTSPRSYEKELISAANRSDTATLFESTDKPQSVITDRHNPAKAFSTQQVNTSLRRPYEIEMISASFESPDKYYLKKMIWLVITSLLLIFITLFCFGYTVKTLLSQHKLALLKDDFINNMTHEINTPLSSIQITAEALKVFDHDRTTRQEYLDIISYQSEKLKALIAQILTIRGVDKSIHNNFTSVELNGLIETAIRDLSPQIESGEAIISYRAASQPLYINGIASGLLNAVVNIIDNALKYADDKASLDITLTAERKQAVITFTDQGIGIPTEYHDKVFDRFFRVPKGNTHDVKGYGLGLSYVKEVIEQHRGKITVGSNNTSGSVFTIKLPLN